jgi:NAD(P)H-hydrate epimerase
MATGGSGDVLTGIVLALLAQGYSAEDSAIIAVYLHGLAGDMAAASLSQTAMTSADIISYLPKVWLNIEKV